LHIAENAWGIQQIEAMKEEIKEMRKALENTNMENRHLRWVTNIMGHEKVRLDEERSDELNGNIGAVKGVATIFTSS